MIIGDPTLAIHDHHAMLEHFLEVLIIIHLPPVQGDTLGQFHLEIEGTGTNHAQGLPMVQEAVAAVEAWTTLSSAEDNRGMPNQELEIYLS